MGILRGGKKIRMPLQLLLDLRARAGDPRFDGAERHAKYGGDLLVRHAVHVAQHDGDAHVVIQRLNAIAHQARPLVRFGALLRIRGRDPESYDVAGDFFVGHDAVPPAAPEVVITEVGGDLEQPGLEGRLTQGADLLPGAKNASCAMSAASSGLPTIRSAML